MSARRVPAPLVWVVDLLTGAVRVEWRGCVLCGHRTDRITARQYRAYTATGRIPCRCGGRLRMVGALASWRGADVSRTPDPLDPISWPERY